MNEGSYWVRMDRLRAVIRTTPPETFGCLSGLLNLSAGGAFQWDEPRMVQAINATSSGWSIDAKRLNDLRPHIERLFVPIKDGTWLAPNPEIFVLNDPESAPV